MAEVTRQRPVRVLHLGMPKTGTLSMMNAYRKLGLTTYHGTDFTTRPQDQPVWEKAIDAKYHGKGKPFEKKDFDAFLGDREALSDFPVLFFTEEFMSWYPEAKIVLVERDIDKWAHTFNTRVVTSLETWICKVLLVIEPYVTARPASIMSKGMHAFFECSSTNEMRRKAKEIYSRQYATVRTQAPKERTLEYKLGSGWEPLCKFLDKPVPDEAFPWLNESIEFEKWMKAIQREKLGDALRALSKYIVAPALIGVMAWAAVSLGIEM